MKQLILLQLLFFYFNGQAQKNGNTPLKMKGVYSMTYQMLNNGRADSVMGKQQLKIFTDKHVMFAGKISPTDSLAFFGVGTYRVVKDKVKEDFFYYANTGNTIDSATLSITTIPKGYQQVIIYPAVNDTVFTLTEKYNKVGKAIPSPLDGAWKLKKSYLVNLKGDTLVRNYEEYKIYQNGYFMWGAGFKDSATNNNKGFFGYGKFKFTGNKIIEINENTSFMTDLYLKPVAVDIKFLGKNEYMQVIKNPTAGKQVEIYQRM